MIQWSQQYYTGLTYTEHVMNNHWFNRTLRLLKEDGVLYVPTLNKSFNKQGEEICTQNAAHT